MQSTLDRISEWMTRQSWYSPAADGLPRLRELAEVFLPSPDPLARVRVVLVRDDAADEPVIYQLPLVERDVLPDPSAPGIIGRGYGGATVFDGVGDSAFAAAVLAGMHEAGRLRDEADDRFVVASEVVAEESGAATVRVTPFGRPDLDLRILRRVIVGRHPHAIAAEALADRAVDVGPRLAGTLDVRWTEDGTEQTATIVIAEESVDGTVDGWTAAVDAAVSGRTFDAEAFGIGEALAAAHESLAASSGDRPVTPEERRVTIETWRARVLAAGADVPELTALVPALDRIVDLAAELPSWPSLQAVHGRLELGLVERRPDGRWLLRAFGGAEPRPAADRSDLALRDLAAALRSLHYAARLAEASPLWESSARRALLDGYGARGAAIEFPLLDALEADFAVIDAVWEARSRPELVRIPVGAITRIAMDAASREGLTAA